MTRILITSGPTRQYIDPIRYLTNASSGRMGSSLAAAAIAVGYEVVVVSGPVEVDYPTEARVIPIVSTEEMLVACTAVFPDCDGVIGVAAACDYRPITVAPTKLTKEDLTRGDGAGGEFMLRLVETPDIMAALAKQRRASTADRKSQWMVSFALETNDHRVHALQKLQRKCSDMVVLNDSSAMNAIDTSVELIVPGGETVGKFCGSKAEVAQNIVRMITEKLIS
ncbi:MAG: phosphopantothenoylcysteine decarboxylase [Thermoguttaceae bacterium]|nr:phosphopantothenoylcysteine decarboxylase [Thermoguttaceae bacterium]